MKKKALITSILLGLTLIALVGYLLAGCSAIQDRISRQTREESHKGVVSNIPADDRDQDSQPKIVDSEFQLGEETTAPVKWEKSVTHMKDGDPQPVLSPAVSIPTPKSAHLSFLVISRLLSSSIHRSS